MKLKQNIAPLIAAAAMLLGLANPAQAEVKVDVVFKHSGWTMGIIPTGKGMKSTTCEDGGPGYPSNCVDIRGDVYVYDVATGQSRRLTNANKAVVFEDTPTGSTRLYRFEWRPSVASAYQVVDAWIHIPSSNEWNQVWVYDIPAHNVVFSNVFNRDLGLLPSVTIGERRQNSIINKWQDPVMLLQGNSGEGPRNVGMLDGCYSVYHYADNTCPGAVGVCVRNYLDYPLCVGGDPGASNSVDLSIDE